MADSIFDIALEKRFTDSTEIATIDVTSADMLLIRDSASGAIMRLSFATLAAAISSAFGSSFASLVDGKVPASQLPSYVDDVLEYANTGAFPGTGESGKIYVAIDTNKTYRWSGSAYVEISASLALGETSSTAYRGDRGKTAYDHSQVSGNPHGTTKADVGLSNVDNTSDANKPVSTAQATAIATKQPLNANLTELSSQYSVRKIIIKGGIADNSPTPLFRITTTNETDSNDGGMYFCRIWALFGNGANSGSGAAASKTGVYLFTRSAKGTGDGANSAVSVVSETNSAAAFASTRDIGTVIATVAEINEYTNEISFQIDATGAGSVDLNAILNIEVFYYGYVSKPAIVAV